MAEAGLALLLADLGLHLLNDSPPNCLPKGCRFFEGVPDYAPAQVQRVVPAWLAAVGGVHGAARLRAREVRWPWLRRALCALELLLQSGCIVVPTVGEVPAGQQRGHERVLPLLAAAARGSEEGAHYTALQCAELLLLLAATAGGTALEEYAFAPWCYAGTCRCTALLCSCLVSLELRAHVRGERSLLPSAVMALYRKPAEKGGALRELLAPAPRAAVAQAVAEAPMTDKELLASANVSALNAILLSGSLQLSAALTTAQRKALRAQVSAVTALLEATHHAAVGGAGIHFQRGTRLTSQGDVGAAQELAAGQLRGSAAAGPLWVAAVPSAASVGRKRHFGRGAR